MDRMVNNIQLIWKLICMFRANRIFNPTVELSKYKFNNKLLDSVQLFRVILNVTLT